MSIGIQSCRCNGRVNRTCDPQAKTHTGLRSRLFKRLKAVVLLQHPAVLGDPRCQFFLHLLCHPAESVKAFLFKSRKQIKGGTSPYTGFVSFISNVIGILGFHPCLDPLDDPVIAIDLVRHVIPFFLLIQKKGRSPSPLMFIRFFDPHIRDMHGAIPFYRPCRPGSVSRFAARSRLLPFF